MACKFVATNKIEVLCPIKDNMPEWEKLVAGFEYFISWRTKVLRPINLRRRVSAAARRLLERALLTKTADQRQENLAIWPSRFNELQKLRQVKC
jgi:hypothetical protein